MPKLALEFESSILGKPTELFVYLPKKWLKYDEELDNIQGKEEAIETIETIEAKEAKEIIGCKGIKESMESKNPKASHPPVVYLLHGKSGKGSSFYDHTDLIRCSEKYNVITLAPNMDNSYYTNMVHGERYFDFLTKEIPFMVKNALRISLDQENTHVLGYSMGGYGAMKLGLTYPNRFKSIASLSGSLRSVDENRELMKSQGREDLKLCYGEEKNSRDEENDLYHLIHKALKEEKRLPELYLYCGKNDGLITYNLQFIEFLRQQKIPCTFVQDEGNHDFTYWNQQLEQYFKMISRNEE